MRVVVVCIARLCMSAFVRVELGCSGVGTVQLRTQLVCRRGTSFVLQSFVAGTDAVAHVVPVLAFGQVVLSAQPAQLGHVELVELDEMPMGVSVFVPVFASHRRAFR